MPRESLWRQRDFVKLWIGQAISQMGSRITRTALPMVAVMVLGASPFQMGLLTGASAVSVLLFGLFAGAWADRLRRRPILIVADVGRAAVLLAVPAAAYRHALSMPLLYVVAAGAGLLTVLFDVSYQAYVPSLVERENILQANSKLALLESVAEVSGPGLAGFLVQAFTAPMALLWDAASFVVSAISLAAIHKSEPGPERAAQAHIVREIADGLRASRRDPYLRAMALRTGTFAFSGGLLGSMYTLFTVGKLRVPPATLGVIVSLGGAFAIAGSALAERITGRLGFGRAMTGAAVYIGVAAFLNPMAHGSLVVCCAFLAAGQLGDFAWPLLYINELSLRQSVADPQMLGRVNSAMNLLFNGIVPIGAFAAGVLATAIGVRATMLAGAAGILASSLWVVFSPVRHLRELPAATKPATSAVT